MCWVVQRWELVFWDAQNGIIDPWKSQAIWTFAAGGVVVTWGHSQSLDGRWAEKRVLEISAWMDENSFGEDDFFVLLRQIWLESKMICKQLSLIHLCVSHPQKRKPFWGGWIHLSNNASTGSNRNVYFWILSDSKGSMGFLFEENIQKCFVKFRFRHFFSSIESRKKSKRNFHETLQHWFPFVRPY